MTCGASGRPSFFVRGLPVAQGSMRGFAVKGRVVITTTAKGLGPWRRLIADQAQALAPPVPWDGPVAVRLLFLIPRPKGEPKTRRTFPIRRPDLDKLQRAAFDALTHVLWRDDSQVVEALVAKRWANDPFEAGLPPGVLVQARRSTGDMWDTGPVLAEVRARDIVEGHDPDWRLEWEPKTAADLMRELREAMP